MRKGHMIGITPAHPNPNFKLMREMGIKWVRLGYAFPFADDNGTISDAFKKADEEIDRFISEGFEVMSSFPGAGSMRYADKEKKTVYVRSVPYYVGNPADKKYLELIMEAAAFLGAYTKDKISWWQIANEPDIDIFRGPLTDDEVAGYLLAAARGINKGNPNAKCGINLGYINENARTLLKDIYAIADTPFAYLGLDGYAGSWQAGGPETWIEYINETVNLSGKPIIINEWGFSSLQWGEKYTDIERKNHYNQHVCFNKYWGITWGKGHTPDEQARYIKECIPIFANHPHVIGNFFFRWSDTESCWQCGEADCPAECAWGCTDTAQKPKPSYYALQACIKEYFNTAD